jgi:hypothetical protein
MELKNTVTTKTKIKSSTKIIEYEAIMLVFKRQWCLFFRPIKKTTDCRRQRLTKQEVRTSGSILVADDAAEGVS